jgi:hypothetical protein
MVDLRFSSDSEWLNDIWSIVTFLPSQGKHKNQKTMEMETVNT